MGEEEYEGEGPAETSSPAEPSGQSAASEPENWRRRRKLAEVFGDEPPAATGDAHDRWLRDQVPPHHG